MTVREKGKIRKLLKRRGLYGDKVAPRQVNSGSRAGVSPSSSKRVARGLRSRADVEISD